VGEEDLTWISRSKKAHNAMKSLQVRTHSREDDFRTSDSRREKIQQLQGGKSHVINNDNSVAYKRAQINTTRHKRKRAGKKIASNRRTLVEESRGERDRFGRRK